MEVLYRGFAIECNVGLVFVQAVARKDGWVQWPLTSTGVSKDDAIQRIKIKIDAYLERGND